MEQLSRPPLWLFPEERSGNRFPPSVFITNGLRGRAPSALYTTRPSSLSNRHGADSLGVHDWSCRQATHAIHDSASSVNADTEATKGQLYSNHVIFCCSLRIGKDWELHKSVCLSDCLFVYVFVYRSVCLCLLFSVTSITCIQLPCNT